jgi:hypothetical protein
MVMTIQIPLDVASLPRNRGRSGKYALYIM